MTVEIERPMFKLEKLWKILVVVGVAFSLCGFGRGLDENLCPVKKQPERYTVLILDLSDPLTPKHKSELNRVIRDLIEPKENSDASYFYVAPGEALVVYQLTNNLESVDQVVKVCSPCKNPKRWTWKDDLVQGRAICRQQWKRFEHKLDDIYKLLDESNPQSSSPILEFLGVILPRYAPSGIGNLNKPVKRTHIILVSDLLQHSRQLSHYGSYPSPKEITTTPGLRAVALDLTGVDFSLFRLERSTGGRRQTKEHYYWWTELIKEFGGRLRLQDAF